MINIGLLGLGTVGKGVIEILEKRKEQIESVVGEEIKVKTILIKNKNKKRDIDKDYILTDKIDKIIDDLSINVIIEVTSDLKEAYKYIVKSLNKGKHVVTANKAVVSKYFEELSNLAEEKEVSFLYEASVGGGIPIIKPLKEELVLNKITKVQGILNGTCNYILTSMFEEGLEYEDVLYKAQKLGYAEADPSADVDGFDTLRKLRILGTLSFQGKIEEKDIILKGISNISSFDVKQIKSLNSTLKLIGEIKEFDCKYSALILPTIIKEDSYFSNVNMAYNSISFIGDSVGDLKFYGSGAGMLPTGDAILRDVVDAILGSTNLSPLGNRKLINNNSNYESSFYLRVSSDNDEIYKKLKSKSQKILSKKKYIAVITKKLKLKDIDELIKSIGIKDNEYFIARIID